MEENTIQPMEAVNEINKQPELERFSYSQISCYKQCHLKWLLHYKEKNYLFSDSIATTFGTAVHEAEEHIAIAIRDKFPIDYKTIKNQFIIKCHKIAQKYPEDFFKADKSERTYQQKMYEYLDKAIYRLEKFMVDHPYLEIIGIEQKFEFDYDGIHAFTGAIDRAFRDTRNGDILIQDIKTWPVPAKDSELRAPLQFGVYTMAAEHIWGVNSKFVTCEYDLPICGISQGAISTDIVADTKPELDKLFKGIMKNEFKPTVSALCAYCSYNPIKNTDLINTKPGAICPYFSTWQKSGDNVRDTLFKWEGPENIAVDRQLLISQLKQRNNTHKELVNE